MTFSGNQNQITLNFNSYGNLTVQLPQGPSCDLYRLYLSVNIIDNENGLTVFNLISPVVVLPDDSYLWNLTQSIIFNDLTNSFVQDLYCDNLYSVGQRVISLSTIANIKSNDLTPLASTSVKSSQISLYNQQSNITQFNNQMATLRTLLAIQIANLTALNISGMKVMTSALSVATQIPFQVTRQLAVKFVLFYHKSKSKFTFDKRVSCTSQCSSSHCSFTIL